MKEVTVHGPTLVRSCARVGTLFYVHLNEAKETERIPKNNKMRKCVMKSCRSESCRCSLIFISSQVELGLLSGSFFHSC